MFINREKELEILNKDYENNLSSYRFVYGRRNIGKTTFINKYLENKEMIYLACTEMIPSLMYVKFSEIIYKYVSKDSINQDECTSFTKILELISKCSFSKKIVIVFDDFQYLQKNDKTLMTIFKDFWNKELCSKKIQIIFLSSYCTAQNTIHTSNTIYLEPLDYKIIKTVLPNVNKNDIMYIYASFGTNPQYLKLYDIRKDFVTNIKEVLLNYKNQIFYEGLYLIKNELNDVSTYCSILHAIAVGNHKIGDIAKALKVNSSYLTRYLQKLLEIMIIKRSLPLGEDVNNTKFGRYDIDDNFLKFWFCYIYPNYHYLQKNDIYPVISFIRQDFSKRLVKDAYKKYVMSLLQSDSENFLSYEPIEIGSWWNNKDVEIDIVSYDKSEITFIDCKWREKFNIKYEYSKLQSNAKSFQSNLTKKYIIFAKNQITQH